MNDIYLGDGVLEDLLKRAGSHLGASRARDLIRGVAAAPEPFDPGAWMVLAGAGADPELERQLAALEAETRASMETVPANAATAPARLGALRGELKRRRLHGFIVPHGDQHLGEYIPKQAQRLAWLTGFTGSAGLAVVLKKRAAFFVDGRYTLQAEAEVDGAKFEFLHMVDDPPAEWIAANVAPKARLGYDPWLHTPEQVARFRAACGKAGAKLVALADNPLDAVWTDQPPPPIAPVVAHDIAFAGKPAADKRRHIADGLAGAKLDAAVLSAPDSIAWLLNIRGGDVPFTPLALAFAVVHADGAVELFLDRRKLTPGLAGHLGDGVAVDGPDAFGPALDRLGAAGKTVRLDSGRTPAWIFDRLEKAGAGLSKGDDPCALPKALKTPVELAGIRAAHRRDGAALTRFLAWLAERAPGPGINERVAAERLGSFRRRNDRYRGPSFPTISATGSNGAIVHYQVSEKTNRTLEEGSLYLVDSGGQYLDGTTDVTRTVAVGAPGREMRQRFTRVLKGHIAIATARFPKGVTGPQLDTLARRSLWEAGLDYDHGTGHGVGAYLGVHEGPQRISRLPNKVPLEPGMVVSNEPGYYKAGEYGIRIENLVVVTGLQAPDGAEKELLGFDTLTLAPIDLALVEPALLDAGERAWLDSYHARVGEELAPFVDGDAAAWLARAIRPVGS